MKKIFEVGKLQVFKNEDRSEPGYLVCNARLTVLPTLEVYQEIIMNYGTGSVVSEAVMESAIIDIAKNLDFDEIMRREGYGHSLSWK